jgi:hypothetical protein
MPDLKIVVKTTAPNRPALAAETITYIQSDRKRVEERRQSLQSLRPGGLVAYLPAPPIVTITRCDLDQVFILNLDDREYMSMPVRKRPSREELQARAAQLTNAAEPPRRTVLIEVTTKDTGERKQMFGFPARHVMTTQKQIPLVIPGQSPQENVTDGWYIDLDTSIPCEPGIRAAVFALSGGPPRKPDDPPQIPIPAFTTIGKPERGFALETKQFLRATISAPDRPAQIMESFTNETQVTELSVAPLDPALFEVPKNFRQVQQIRRTPLVPLWRRWLAWYDDYWTTLKRAF